MERQTRAQTVAAALSFACGFGAGGGAAKRCGWWSASLSVAGAPNRHRSREPKCAKTRPVGAFPVVAVNSIFAFVTANIRRSVFPMTANFHHLAGRIGRGSALIRFLLFFLAAAVCSVLAETTRTWTNSTNTPLQQPQQLGAHRHVG
jgi:hypothetical protein